MSPLGEQVLVFAVEGPEGMLPEPVALRREGQQRIDFVRIGTLGRAGGRQYGS